MEMNLIAYLLIVLVALYGLHEVVSFMFYMWMVLSMKAAHKVAARVVKTRWFKDHYYLDNEDDEF